MYSCKTRYFCPSCHQKRVLLYAEWVEANVLAPVAHRQYVFTVPKLLRPAFSRHRACLGALCRIAARLLVKAPLARRTKRAGLNFLSLGAAVGSLPPTQKLPTAH